MSGSWERARKPTKNSVVSVTAMDSKQIWSSPGRLEF